ncbi:MULTISPECIES: glycosyl hydrolase [unclassified Leeuwenhoekiella]|uniref:WD40/YVTN/BNR-like repeat-containing protein n=1 Tax=unclassified Leeuwenhoekiella TaxID=2615029 RepID=UPI000C6302E4|nr:MULTISPECIES: glycosyl hydrolase [unclassified Leeuwenhoekiella]MAW95799.1 glycosyl hydrolase [Leeuwenhoekiella sp.]MBA82930.1 glycosyl hydrolase [Leeuwenhoekiella sp.]|tara:strand:- start:13988 stop:16831 length:2844 start_codon:yes stop_codon:yes gene_type:complete
MRPFFVVLSLLVFLCSTAQESIVKNIPFKNIGPTIMSGRVVDIDVNPQNPAEFYVGYATGGVWHTVNNGITFESVFDTAPTQNVGDIAINWDENIIWVGTGETISSRSSYAGVGLLKSADGGKTWEQKGLLDSHHISDIILDENNPEVVVVASLGHLYSPNEERGVFKTTDGGDSWSKTLFVSDDAGIISLVAAPENPNVMYAASWDRERAAWNFRGAGVNSGIYKSTDAGDTWQLVTADTAFPQGEGTGRIGLAVVDANTVYAVHDNQNYRDEEEKKDSKKKDELEPEQFQGMTKAEFLALEEAKLKDYLQNKRFPREYDVEKVKELVKNDELKPIDFYKYTYDRNAPDEEGEVIGAEVFKTTDGGKTWNRTHEGYIDDFFFSYGYVFAEMTVNPQNPDEFYMVGVPIVKSEDGGKTFSYIDEPNLHVDHHVVWIDPKMPNHLINGNDGGLNMSYDGGKTWSKLNSMPLGQFYAINVDYEKPYNVYGGLQDNGTWKGPSTYEASTSWEAEGKYPYERVGGGDGMQVQIDRRNSDIIYVGSQFGYYNRINLETGDRKFIRPSHDLGEEPYRFNWETPILLSSHNQDILYLGGNKLMRSMNQGDDWTAISPDLTTGGKKGNVPYGTLTTISESPFQFGLLYTGSDDGLIQVTQDAGGSWDVISQNLPQELWISTVLASKHKKSRVYTSLNGYRYDDFKPYVYVSDDYGTTWKDISANLPNSPVNVIIEDPVKENILYLGTDEASYVSFDSGKSWELFKGSMPAVAVHDMVVQTEANDLVVGTHGRSIFISNLNDIQSFDPGKNEALQLFKIEDVDFSTNWGRSWSAWSEAYTPEIQIGFYAPVAGTAMLEIQSETGKTLKSWEVAVDKGFNYVPYDLSITEKGKDQLEKATKDLKLKKADNGVYYLPAGKYTLEVNLGGNSKTITLEVKEGSRRRDAAQAAANSPEED